MAQVIDRFRASTLGWLRGSLAGWGVVALALAGLAAMVMAGGGVLPLDPLAPLALTAIALGIVLWRWIANLATTYEITADRLILHTGIVAKSIDEIELYRVKNVRIDFSIVNQIADIGDITVTSSDETTRGGALVMRDVPHARARRERLRELVNDARRSRGVREIDMTHEDVA